MKNKLLPCPFCGKKPRIYKVPKFPKGYHWTVKCERLDVIVYTRSMQSKKEAIEAWNRRAEDNNASNS